MESLKLLPSLLIAQFAFTFTSFAICRYCRTGIRRQQERKAFHLISKMAGWVLHVPAWRSYIWLYCWLTDATQCRQASSTTAERFTQFNKSFYCVSVKQRSMRLLLFCCQDTVRIYMCVFISSVLGEWHHPVQRTGRPVWVLLWLQELEQNEGKLSIDLFCEQEFLILLVQSGKLKNQRK